MALYNMKLITIKALYEDGSGYHFITFIVGDENAPWNKIITGNTSSTTVIPQTTTNAQEFLNTVKDAIDIDLKQSYADINGSKYPGYDPNLTYKLRVEKLKDVYPLMPELEWNKPFILNNHKYRLALQEYSTNNYSRRYEAWDEENETWEVCSPGLSGVLSPGVFTIALEATNLSDIVNTIDYKYASFTTDFIVNTITSMYYRLQLSARNTGDTGFRKQFIDDLIQTNPINPDDPYAEDPSTLPSDTIGDDIATGYMQYGDTNMFTIFVPTQEQIQDFASQMYGSDLFTWLQGLGLSLQGVNNDIMNFYVLPTTVTATGKKYVSGNRIPINSSVEMNYTNTNYIIVDCGSVTIPKLYNNFLDYTSQIQIYLPFVGYQSLDTEDVMGKTLNVTYRIDLLTGDSAITIKVNGSVMYQFQGNTAYGLPGSADHYSDIIQKGLTAATMIAVGKSAQNAGQTQLNQSEQLYGAGKLDATEAAKMAAGGESEIARGQAIKQKAVGDLSNIKFGGSTRSGAMGGNTGLLSVTKPYLIIKRPKVEVPQNYGVYNGYPCNKYLSLGSLTGYTEVEDIHIENINATLGEIEEIESLLKQGVTF